MNKIAYVPLAMICATSAALAEAATNSVAAVAAASSASDDAALVEKHSAGASRWRISVGARFAPGVKAHATTSRGAGARLSKIVTMSPKGGKASTSATEHRTVSSAAPVLTSSDESFSETVAPPESGRYEFADGSFIDVNDSEGVEGETWYWNVVDASVFDEGSGTFTFSETEAGPSDSDGDERDSTENSSRTASSVRESGATDSVNGVFDDDIWGLDVSIGYDFYVEGPFSIGLGLGASLYQDADSFATRARCYSGGYTKTTVRTTVNTRETSSSSSSSAITTVTKVSDPYYAYEGAAADLRNDDGTLGAGTYDGLDNPHGGYNPVISTTGISTTKTTDTHKESMYRKTIETITRTTSTSSSMMVDLVSEGSVSTWEARLALQPAYQVADWLEIRGTFGVVMTHVDVDVDSTVFVNGAANSRLSSGDDGYVVAGLCGLDAVFTPLEWLDLFVGADIRLGPNDMDFDTGLAQGTVELSRATYRAGISVRF